MGRLHHEATKYRPSHLKLLDQGQGQKDKRRPFLISQPDRLLRTDITKNQIHIQTKNNNEIQDGQGSTSTRWLAKAPLLELSRIKSAKIASHSSCQTSPPKFVWAQDTLCLELIQIATKPPSIAPFGLMNKRSAN